MVDLHEAGIAFPGWLIWGTITILVLWIVWDIFKDKKREEELRRYRKGVQIIPMTEEEEIAAQI